jgi:AAA domain
MSLTDESSNAEGGNGFFSSTTSPLGEETKDGGGNGECQSNGAESFSFTVKHGTRIEMQTLQDVLNRVPEERQWTVDGMLPDSGLGVLGGRHKRGKSTLVIHLSRSVEAGAPFLERATRQAPVVYVNYEMPLDYFASLSKAEPVPKHFYVIDRPEPKLKMETVGAVISEMLKRGFPKGLMVIDSFRGAFKLKAEQENQSGEAGMILRWLQEIGVKTGWLIVIIHHHKKNADAEGADNLSGTGDFGAAPDVIWTWSRPADYLKPGMLEIEGRIPPVDALEVLLSPEECRYLGTKQDSAERDEKLRILNALGIERLTGTQLSDKTGIPYSTVMKRLRSWKDEGKVDCQKGQGTGSKLLWFRIEISNATTKQAEQE